VQQRKQGSCTFEAKPIEISNVMLLGEGFAEPGVLQLLANSIDKMKNKVGTLLIANRKIAG
jgi:hypothetical protein